MAKLGGSVRGSSGHSALIKSLRKRLGLSQERLAARLDVTFSTVNRWENGHAEPSRLALNQLEDLIQAMGPSGSDLLKQILDSKNKTNSK